MATSIPTSEQDKIIKNIKDVNDTYGCMSQNAEMKAFFSNTINKDAIISAVEKYGMPPKNTPSYHTGAGFLGSWHDFCDWDKGIFKVYCYAKISVDYPKLDETTKNCERIRTALVGLKDAAGSAILTEQANQDAIEDKTKEYNSLYAKLACDSFIIDEEKRKARELSQIEKDAAAIALEKAYDKASGNTSTEGSKTSNYILYGFVGVAAIVFLIALIKKSN